jgi:hypothetical protein
VKEPQTTDAIIATYERHGWRARRALTAAAKAEWEAHLDLPTSEFRGFDAIWFSRRSRPDAEAWELRLIGGRTFALVVVLPDTFDDEEREAALLDVEDRMNDEACK